MLSRDQAVSEHEYRNVILGPFGNAQDKLQRRISCLLPSNEVDPSAALQDDIVTNYPPGEDSKEFSKQRFILQLFCLTLRLRLSTVAREM